MYFRWRVHVPRVAPSGLFLRASSIRLIRWWFIPDAFGDGQVSDKILFLRVLCVMLLASCGDGLRQVVTICHALRPPGFSFARDESRELTRQPCRWSAQQDGF